jgi:hypothetical protein
MLPQGHPDHFNIEPCRACNEIRLSHTEIEAERQSDNKSGHVSLAALWKF